MLAGSVPPAGSVTRAAQDLISDFVEVQIRHSVAAQTETPAPVDLGSGSIYLYGTGQIILPRSPDDLVRDASQLVQDLAVIPIDSRDEEIVNRLITRKQAGENITPLIRRV